MNNINKQVAQLDLPKFVVLWCDKFLLRWHHDDGVTSIHVKILLNCKL